MRLSCLPVSYFGVLKSGEMTFGEWAGIATELGLDGIDLTTAWLSTFDEGYLAGVRAQLDRAGQKLAMLVTYTDFTHPDRRQRRREVEWLPRVIDAATALGAKYVRITAGQAYEEVRRCEGLDLAVEGLTACLEYARRKGVRLLYENHSKPVVWDRYDFAYSSENFLAIARATEGSDLGILFDTANTVSYGDDPLPVLDQVIHRVEYVHAADIKGVHAVEHVLLGTGIVPFHDIFARLQRDGYSGWISLEENSRTGKDGVARATTYVRDTWDALSSTSGEERGS